MTNHSTEIMNQATQDFIRQHQDEDVRQLAFLGSKYPEVNMPFALDQIRGRKMAHVKLPRWASIEVNALVSIDSFIDEIEKDFGIDKPKKTRRTRNKKAE